MGCRRGRPWRKAHCCRAASRLRVLESYFEATRRVGELESYLSTHSQAQIGLCIRPACRVKPELQAFQRILKEPLIPVCGKGEVGLDNMRSRHARALQPNRSDMEYAEDLAG